MSSGRPAHDLLLPYLSAAVHQAQAGQELSPRSRWAVESAIEQLTAQREAEASAYANTRRGAAAIVAAVEGHSSGLAELVVGEEEVRAQAEYSTGDGEAAFDSLIEDLIQLTADDAGRSEAASRLDGRFQAAISRIREVAPEPLVAEAANPEP